MKKKVTLSLDAEVYAEFQKFCDENDLMLSKRIERLMKEHLIFLHGGSPFTKLFSKKKKRGNYNSVI